MKIGRPEFRSWYVREKRLGVAMCPLNPRAKGGWWEWEDHRGFLVTSSRFSGRSRLKEIRQRIFISVFTGMYIYTQVCRHTMVNTCIQTPTQ